MTVIYVGLGVVAGLAVGAGAVLWIAYAAGNAIIDAIFRD